ICQISYQRTARVQMTEAGPIRLTLDTDISAVSVHAVSFDDAGTGTTVAERVVLELKFRRFMPALFRELVADFALSPKPFSKYRTALPALGLAGIATIVQPAPLSCLIS
ncbi:MAG: VTC domain-containing protein, partial [Opitutaceae bacterium]